MPGSLPASDLAVPTGPDVPPRSPERALEAASARPRVLCVDDSPAILRQVEELLRGEYEVTLARNGWEGLKCAKANPPEVILCDHEMPELTGLQLLVLLKRDPTLRVIPFIMATAASQPSSARFLDAGAHDFLPKPSSPEELRARLAAAVRSYRMYQQLQAKQERLSAALELLEKNEARARAVLDSDLDAIVLLDGAGAVEELNPAGERIFGWGRGEIAGRPFLETLVAPRSRRALEGRMSLRAAPPALEPPPDLHGLRRTGQEFPIECNFARLGGGAGLCAFVRDLTASKRMQIELHQAQKLEAVGRLAAGIAHEINTPVQFIGDNSHFLQEAFAAYSELLRRYREAARPEALDALRAAEEELELDYLAGQVPKTFTRTEEGVKRIATIVRAMKDFAHPDCRDMVAADLNRGVQATLEVARNEYKYVADVETDLGELPLVTCHAGDVNQVVLNVVVNAAHAIADAVKGTPRRGTIRVATRREGADVVVTISDTGGGIPEAIRDKVFEPFFTTKEVGRGTGQGLAIARAVVTRHRGSIGFESEPGQGTTFTIRIPIDGAPHEEAP